MKTKSFLGIDVGKDSIDICLMQNNTVVYAKSLDNKEKELLKAFKNMVKEYKLEMESLFVCMENTGVYNYILLEVLQQLNLKTFMVAALHIKKSIGLVRGKNDKIDAERIARFIMKNYDCLNLFSHPRPIISQLKLLISYRNRLVKAKMSLKNSLESERFYRTNGSYKDVEKSISKLVKEIDLQISKTENRIDSLITTDEMLNTQFKLIISVQGVGKIIAYYLLVMTNEFKNINDPKKLACYVGVAPFEHLSGSSIKGRPRVSAFANKQMKSLFHMASMSAIRLPGDLKNYYQRKVEEGKNKMSVLNAVRNKIIWRILAVLKSGKPYQNFHSNYLQLS